jgi:hypothetical protein
MSGPVSGVQVMTAPISIAILFAAGGTLIMISAFMLYVMIGKVNRNLPEDQQLGYLGFYPTKAFKITQEYRRFYPRSRLNAVRIVLTVLGFALIVASAARLSHFWR